MSTREPKSAGVHGDAVVDMVFPDVHQMSTTSGGMSTTSARAEAPHGRANDCTCSRSRLPCTHLVTQVHVPGSQSASRPPASTGSRNDWATLVTSASAGQGS